MGLSATLTGKANNYSLQWFLPREVFWFIDILAKIDPSLKGTTLLCFEITHLNIQTIKNLSRTNEFQSVEYLYAKELISKCEQEINKQPDIQLYFTVI